jgi:hypothetical protein
MGKLAVGKRDDTEVVALVSNLPKLDEYDNGVPSPAQFEIWRLKRTIVRLEAEKRRLNDKISQQLVTLQESERLWTLGLHEKQWPTLGEALRHLQRLKSAIACEGRTGVENADRQAAGDDVDLGRRAGTIGGGKRGNGNPGRKNSGGNSPG